MELRAIGVTVDSNDPDRTADFWQAAIGFRKREGDGEPYITLSDSDVGRPLNHLTIQRVPESKMVKHRLHLDLFVADDVTAIAELEALGATVVVPADQPGHVGMTATVMADPDGGEFCVVCRRQEQDSRRQEQDSRRQEQHSRRQEQDSRRQEQHSRRQEQHSRRQEQ